ncbi:TPA: hypothetical protein HA241_00950 [Candidatus Woesearchaeota archaeon]|nr:hypothetical protein [Candidatus Woesearchaeota archaeon]
MKERSREHISRELQVVARRLILLRIGLDKPDGGIPHLNTPAAGFGCIGAGVCHNTPLAKEQILFVLAANFHSTVNKLIKLLGTTHTHQEIGEAVDGLIKRRVFEGIKTLDLGCGFIPVFARVLRTMGAEVYTADVLSADKLEWYVRPEDHNQSAKEAETRNHLCCNLSFPETVEMILRRTGGKFDLITSAHLSTDWSKHQTGLFDFPRSLTRLLQKLLRPFGIYYSPMDLTPRMFLGEEGFMELDII